MKAKFVRGMDSRKSLRIGVWRNRKFSSFEEFLDFLVHKAPQEILGIPDWPESIKGNKYGTKIDDKSIEERSEIIGNLKDWIDNHVNATIMGRDMGGREINNLFSIRSYLLSQFSKGNLSRNIREGMEFKRGGNPRDIIGIGRIVNVRGDRGYGEYRVRLIEKYKGDDIEEDEEVWKAMVIPSGRMAYVIKYNNHRYPRDKGFWGFIDPFIAESAKTLDFQRGSDPRKNLEIGIFDKMKSIKEEEIPEFILKNGPALLGWESWPEDFFIIKNDWYVINPKYTVALFQLVFGDIDSAKYSDRPSIILVNILNKIKGELIDRRGEDISKIREISERLGFRRGKDPRKSIGIGSSYTRRINNKKIAKKILLKDDDEIRKIAEESGILKKYDGGSGHALSAAADIFLGIKEVSEFIVDRGHSIDYATITYGGLYGIFDPESSEGLEDMHNLIEVLEFIGYLFDPDLMKKPLSQWDNLISKNIDDYIYD